MDNSILVWLGICRAKRKGYDHFVTRRYVIKTNHCELSWQPTAAVAKQGQVSFFTFFLYLIERTRRMLNNRRDERMYVSSSREVLLMFFLDESGFCCFAHPVIEIEHQWPSDDHYNVSRSRTCTRDIKEKLRVLGHTAQVVLLFGFSPLSPTMCDGRYTI